MTTTPNLTGLGIINRLAIKQWEWCESVGWHNKTPLEYLALIVSEAGEAMNECRGEQPTDKLGAELADIILRTVDFAVVCGIDIEAAILAKMAYNQEHGKKPERLK